MFQRDDGVIARQPAAPGTPTSKWPRYVRVLAVCYVCSYLVQWLAFLGLTGTAALLVGLRHPLDGLVLGLGLSGIAGFLLCGLFRRWFVRGGRRNYPQGQGPP